MPQSGSNDTVLSIVRSTFRALIETRRLVPILLVSGSLVFVQARLSRVPGASLLGVAMCAAFVLIAPLAWRILLPEEIELRGTYQLWQRLLIYGAMSVGVVLFVGRTIPRALDMRQTLLSMPSTLVVCCMLFLVGGWGLGRDISLELSLLQERQRTVDLAREAERAQLVAMRAHLDPHFLFNTLNAIAEWCREDGEVAERAVLQLSAILRAVLAGVKASAWPLERELDIARALFALHLLRDPGLFRLVWDVEGKDTVESILVPPMILMPIIENAIKHGPSAGYRGRVRLAVSVDGEMLRVCVENPGPYKGPRSGSDGLPTVHRRLALAYDGTAQFRIFGEGDCTRVELELPIRGPLKGMIV